jgi:polysaccharide deacetylase 2 family uncharacterized protein YibQ
MPRRARGAVIALALIAVAGAGLVKFLQSPRGNVVLLDLGVANRYENVQGAIDAELTAALDELGLRDGVQENEVPASVGRGHACREWSLAVPRSQSLIRLNLALSEAVRDAGGFVRSSKERRGETGLTIEAGSRRHTTHRIVIRRGPGGPIMVRDTETPEAAEAPDTEETTGLPPRAAEPSARIALVIDDFGYSRGAIIDEFFDLGVPVTASVIPTLPHSRYVLARAAEAGQQTILHLPMEAESFVSDVPPVTTSMSSEEIESLVGEYLDETPGVVGVNNHLGSLATRDARVMETVLGVIERRRLFFLDSLTSSKSIAYNTAKSLGVPAARNDVFIDADTEDEGVVTERLDRLLDIAKKRGTAVGIGHPRPWTLEAVRACRERARDAGVEFVFLSAIVE